MTDLYSDHFTGAAGVSTVLPVSPIVAPKGLGHSRLRHKIARMSVAVGVDLADNDRLVFCNIRSSDQIGHVYVAVNNANWGAKYGAGCFAGEGNAWSSAEIGRLGQETNPIDMADRTQLRLGFGVFLSGVGSIRLAVSGRFFGRVRFFGCWWWCCGL